VVDTRTIGCPDVLSSPSGDLGEPEYESPQWDDIRFPFTGQQIDTSAGRIDYNYTELGVDFQDNARYPEEVIGMICQLSHGIVIGSDIRPHLHWIQNQNAQPNWLLEYRIYDNGETPPAVWQIAIPTAHRYPWGGVSILQYTTFPEIDGSSLTGLSAFIDFKLYRDTGNVSGLFAGADAYQGDALSKEFDVHILKDTRGSRMEFIK